MQNKTKQTNKEKQTTTTKSYRHITLHCILPQLLRFQSFVQVTRTTYQCFTSSSTWSGRLVFKYYKGNVPFCCEFLNLSHPNIECPVKCIFLSLLCNILSVIVVWKSSYFAQLWCLSLFSENGEGLVTGKFNSWCILFALPGFTVLVFRSELNSISIPDTFDRPHLDVWFKKVIVHVL